MAAATAAAVAADYNRDKPDLKCFYVSVDGHKLLCLFLARFNPWSYCGC